MSILRRSEGREAVTKASKKAVLTERSRMDIEELSPKPRMYSKDDIMSTGSSECVGGGLFICIAFRALEMSGCDPIGIPSTLSWHSEIAERYPAMVL